MICRGAMVPCIMLALGGNLVGGALRLSPILCGVSCHFFPSFYHFDWRMLCKFAFICHQVICRKFVHDTAWVFLYHKFHKKWMLWKLFAGPGSSELGLRTTVAITFARLLLVPPIGLAVVMSADKLGFLPANDKMFRFVLLLQHTMPTSILAGMYISLKSYLRTVLNRFIQELSKMWNR